MLGVTAFGIFLTPVFFYVIQSLGETRVFTGAIMQWVVAIVLGVVVSSTGYLLSLCAARLYRFVGA